MAFVYNNRELYLVTVDEIIPLGINEKIPSLYVNNTLYYVSDDECKAPVRSQRLDGVIQMARLCQNYILCMTPTSVFIPNNPFTDEYFNVILNKGYFDETDILRVRFLVNESWYRPIMSIDKIPKYILEFAEYTEFYRSQLMITLPSFQYIMCDDFIRLIDNGYTLHSSHVVKGVF